VLFASGLGCLLDTFNDIQVSRISDERGLCYTDYFKYNPDVIIMDFSMKGACCPDVLNRILKKDHSAKILVLMSTVSMFMVKRLLALGVKGFCLTTSQPEEFAKAIRVLADGRMYLNSEIAEHLFETKVGEGETLFDTLTEREFEILQLILDGYSTTGIAEKLHVSYKTVANNHTQILHKLGVDNNVMLTRMALQQGLLEI